LERTVSELDREIAALSNSKDALEQALEAKNLPTEVNVENLVTREGRRDIDVVEDEVEDQLQKVCISFEPVLCFLIKTKKIFVNEYNPHFRF